MMSLNYDLSSIKNKDEVCYFIATEDFDGDMMRSPHKKGDRLIHPITEALIFASMQVQLEEITEKNAMEWHVRLETMTKITGTGLFLGDKKNPSLDDIKAHIGLKTNVFPSMTRKKWISSYLGDIISQEMNSIQARSELIQHVKINAWMTETVGLRRTGMVRGYDLKNDVVQMQFGADGPFEDVSLMKLRVATKSEIKEKTGC